MELQLGKAICSVQARRIGLCALLGAVFLAGTLAGNVLAQELDPAALLKPATDTWPTYNGDYSGMRYSTLDQINAGNVGSLTLAWAFRASGSVLKSTPLEVNGIPLFHRRTKCLGGRCPLWPANLALQACFRRRSHRQSPWPCTRTGCILKRPTRI